MHGTYGPWSTTSRMGLAFLDGNTTRSERRPNSLYNQHFICAYTERINVEDPVVNVAAE